MARDREPRPNVGAFFDHVLSNTPNLISQGRKEASLEALRGQLPHFTTTEREEIVKLCFGVLANDMNGVDQRDAVLEVLSVVDLGELKPGSLLRGYLHAVTTQNGEMDYLGSVDSLLNAGEIIAPHMGAAATERITTAWESTARQFDDEGNSYIHEKLLSLLGKLPQPQAKTKNKDNAPNPVRTSRKKRNEAKPVADEATLVSHGVIMSESPAPKDPITHMLELLRSQGFTSSRPETLLGMWQTRPTVFPTLPIENFFQYLAQTHGSLTMKAYVSHTGSALIGSSFSLPFLIFTDGQLESIAAHTEIRNSSYVAWVGRAKAKLDDPSTYYLQTGRKTPQIRAVLKQSLKDAGLAGRIELVTKWFR